MELVIGGVFQGKLEYVKEKYGFGEGEIFTCDPDRDIDPDAKCLYRYEKYVQYCVRNGKKPVTEFGPDAVVIADDVFCGVVPVDGELRAMRDEAGRALAAIAAKADRVTRIFCGIPQVLK